MAKKFQLSDDAGSTYYTFPGDTADLVSNATGIKDTVFGQDFESDQTGLITWTASADGIYKGFAGYVAVIKQSGTPTTMTAEPTTLVSGKTYQITNAVKRVIDRTTAVTVLDNAVDHTTDVISIDYLFGKVTFAGGYTVTGPVTITGKYLPMTQMAKGQEFTLTQTSTAIDTTDFVAAQANGGRKVFDYGLKTVSIDIKGIYALTNAFLANLVARNEMIIEIGPDGGGLSVARGFFKPMSQQQSGRVGELEVEQVKFSLFVPDPTAVPLMPYPFQWNHAAGTTLNTALQKAILGWENKTLPLFKYLWDGTNGYTGSGVITDLSLKGGLDVMNVFDIKIQGSGALTAVP